MSGLQSYIIIVISYLISRIFIDSESHEYAIRTLLPKLGTRTAALTTGILGVSYALSLFFSNTVVVLSMIPILRYLIQQITDENQRKILSSQWILALIYGANIGGMGSITGSPQNVFYLAFLDLFKIQGREHVTFFSWFMVGVPATLLLVLVASWILKIGEKKLPRSLELKWEVSGNGNPFFKRFVLFFAVNIALIFCMTALQFFFQPGKIFLGLNIIDLFFSSYFVVFLFVACVFPRKERTFPSLFRNLVFLLLYTAFAPFIFINETVKETRCRFRRPSIDPNGMDRRIQAGMNSVWRTLFREPFQDLRQKNENVFISANRILYDLPFFGLFFMGGVTLLALLFLKIGDNPATPGMDGLLVRFIERIANGIIPQTGGIFLFLTAVIFVAIFLTEVLNNTTVLLIMLPLVGQMSTSMGENPLLFLLAVTLAASGAFMTPIATPVNAVSYASFPGVSLKRMLGLGFLLNLAAGAFFTFLVFFLLNVIRF